MKPINWNSTKNQQLVTQRGISFEDIVFYMQQGRLLDDIKHPNSVELNRYAVALRSNRILLQPSGLSCCK